MNATQICAKQTYTEDGTPLFLQYDLVVTYGFINHYGVRVRMQYRGKSESSCYRYVTASEESALRLIRRLADGLVTPTCLDEILEELFAMHVL